MIKKKIQKFKIEIEKLGYVCEVVERNNEITIKLGKEVDGVTSYMTKILNQEILFRTFDTAWAINYELKNLFDRLNKYLIQEVMKEVENV